MAHTCHRMFKHLKSQILCGRVVVELFFPSMQEIFLGILYNILRIFWYPKCVSEMRDKNTCKLCCFSLNFGGFLCHCLPCNFQLSFESGPRRLIGLVYLNMFITFLDYPTYTRHNWQWQCFATSHRLWTPNNVTKIFADLFPSC